VRLGSDDPVGAVEHSAAELAAGVCAKPAGVAVRLVRRESLMGKVTGTIRGHSPGPDPSALAFYAADGTGYRGTTFSPD
jgi:hypothetical protein